MITHACAGFRVRLTGIVSVVALLLSVACGRASTPTTPQSTHTTQAAAQSPQSLEATSPRERHPASRAFEGQCGSSGSTSDLALEPPYSANYLHRWTTDAGCEIRLDVAMTRFGRDSCGGLAVADILIGKPLGNSHSTGVARNYLRDPTGFSHVDEYKALFDEDAELPSAARDTGLRQTLELWPAPVQLWMVPEDDAFAYLVMPDRVERWPMGGVGCA